MSRPSQRGEWPGALIGLGVQMLQLPLLPFRLLGLGVQAMTQALAAGQQVIAELETRGEEPGAAPDPGRLAGPQDWVQPAWVEVARRAEPFTGGPVERAAVAAAGPAGPEPFSVDEATFAGGAASSGAAAGCSETHTKEDKKMSCNCDQSLSGCELKIVQYSIVSVSPYISDGARIIIPMRTIATSDDMTGEDFTALVIARNMRQFPDRFKRRNMQYIRVCYFVLCRLAMPCADYERQQAEALRAIDETLRRKNLGEGGGGGGGRRYEEEEERSTELVFFGEEEAAPETVEETPEGNQAPRGGRGRRRREPGEGV